MRGVMHVKVRVLVALCALLAAGTLLLLGGAAGATAAPGAVTPVPPGFVGMNADGPIFDSGVNLPQQLKDMVASGVERIRVLFPWASAQPYASCQDVPADQMAHFTGCPGSGVPTDFRFTDRVVELAGYRRLPVIPVIKYVPAWDNAGHDMPSDDGPFGDYARALVQRYGPRGSFWVQHPSVPFTPITSWQVWNEPDLGWGSDWASPYVKLLRVARHDIREADPRATIVLAALTNYSWQDLTKIYEVSGARKLFNTVTINAYTAHPSGVITILDRDRSVMNRHGDARKLMMATEIGWPAALGKTPDNPGFETTNQGQATKLERLLPLLAENRQRLRLKGFFYYTWMSTGQGHHPFKYSGLLRFDATTGQLTKKPAYWAFRKAVRKLEY